MPGLAQLQDKIVVCCALTIYPYSLATSNSSLQRKVSTRNSPSIRLYRRMVASFFEHFTMGFLPSLYQTAALLSPNQLWICELQNVLIGDNCRLDAKLKLSEERTFMMRDRDIRHLHCQMEMVGHLDSTGRTA